MLLSNMHSNSHPPSQSINTSNVSDFTYGNRQGAPATAMRNLLTRLEASPIIIKYLSSK
jgi:hypothetical protein